MKADIIKLNAWLQSIFPDYKRSKKKRSIYYKCDIKNLTKCIRVSDHISDCNEKNIQILWGHNKEIFYLIIPAQDKCAEVYFVTLDELQNKLSTIIRNSFINFK